MAIITADWVQPANLLVQLLILVALVWYAVETWRIRKLSIEQVEALQKPCLTLTSKAREFDEAVLETDGIVGGMIVAAQEGNLAVQNIGSGPALNVRYEFNPINPPRDATVARPSGYLQSIQPRGIFAMAVPREVLRNLEYEFIAVYESLNGRKYWSHLRIENLVLTFSEFGPFVRSVGGHMPNDEQPGQVHDWWRFFGNLRFTQLAFYGIAAGLLLNALHDGVKPDLQNKIALAGVLITSVVWLMEVSSTLHGIAWKKLAKPDPPMWLLPPFSASNAALAFYLLAYIYWWSMAIEYLRVVKTVFWVLVIWSVFAYLPLWFHSLKMLRTSFSAYINSFRSE